MGDIGEKEVNKGLGDKNSFSYFEEGNDTDRAERKNTPYCYPYSKENIQFILSHFQEPLFPRTISTQKSGGRQIQVNDFNEIYEKFEKSNFVDCRINAFPAIEKKPVPNFVFIDLDANQKKISLGKVLQITLSNIKKRLAGSPTVLWTGNGYHIYQPIDCPVSLSIFDELKEFDNPDNMFLRFEKDFLSKGYADEANHPSLKSCLLRVPGSLNSKCLSNGLTEEESKVKIIQKWDLKRVPISYQIGTFYSYLKSEKMKEEKRRAELQKYKKIQKSYTIPWIERLLKTSIEDHRKLCLWHILIPYLVNIKGLHESEIHHIVESWLNECDKKRRIDFNPKYMIKSNLKDAKDFLPISKENLRKKYPDLYELIIE